jgi:dihydropteroate synthase
MSAGWRCASTAFPLDEPLVMGILNVTPDSFSDGGEHGDLPSALRHGRAMRTFGADIVDVGGESTRPGADSLAVGEESKRVVPVVRRLAAEGACVSIDTRHASVAAECVSAGASIINDVSGFRDAAMVELARHSDAGLVVMHMAGEPKTMQDEPHYDDVVAEVAAFLVQQASLLREAGIAADRIAIDPGIGFGKTFDNNLELLRRLPELAALGYPVVIGASRKRFIGAITGEPVASNRVWGSLGAAVVALERGASVLRVHDVRETVHALKVARAIEAQR